MKEQGRPTLTLRRKTEPEGQRAVNNSEPDGVGPGRVTRKKTVVVNTTPAWKVRKQAVDESAKKRRRTRRPPEKQRKPGSGLSDRRRRGRPGGRPGANQLLNRFTGRSCRLRTRSRSLNVAGRPW